MHDLFEGIMPVTLKCVIKHLLRSCNTLSLVGNDVPHGNIGWEVYLILREICDIVIAPIVDSDSIYMLEELVAMFLKTFSEVFGSEYIIPKMHMLVHYPRLIRLFGPLRNFWCLRFESKHQYFKKAASNGRYFKNITKTLSKRHQMLQCWEMLTGDMLLSNYTVSGNAPRFFHNLDVKVQEAIRLLLNLDIEGNESIVIAKSISVMSKLANVVQGEDDISIKKHQDALKNEIKKQTPSFDIIKEKMKRTCEYRQLFCHAHTTAEVLEGFPCLRLNIFFTADVLLLYGVDVTNLKMKFLTLYDGVIKEAAKRCKKYCEYSRMINKYLEKTLDNDKQQDWKVMFVTLLLPSLFGEKEELFFPLPKQQIPLSPVILSQDDEWNISVDKEVLFLKTISTFSAAFQAWFAAFWIFSIEFPKGLSNTCQFLEKVLLGGKGK
nr:uncharacterized protein LOC124812702 [Hydra vulgaris]